MSERIYTADGVYIAEAMLNHLNTWLDKPTLVKLEALDKNPPGIMLQQLSGATIVRKYVNGSYIGSWPFAVYVRISGKDTANKLDASACLYDLGKWLENTSYPSIGSDKTITKIEMTSCPSIAQRFDNGVEDYQAIFNLSYNARRN